MTPPEELAGVPALVLGAGFGTRLRPLTDHIPKPVVPLLGRPLIGHALIHLYAGGCQEVHVNAFHEAGKMQAMLDAWVQRRLLRLRLRWSVEAPQILGTGGALRRVEDRLCTGPFLLLNGDAVLGMDLPALWAAHRANREQGAEATLLCRPRPPGSDLRRVLVDAEGRILEMTGLGRRAGVTAEQLAAAREVVFCGVHAIEPSAVAVLPPDGQESCIVRQGYIPMLAEGRDVRAHVEGDDLVFHDVGTAGRYLEAQRGLFEAGDRRVLAVAPGVDAKEALYQEASYAADAEGREYGSPDAVEGLATATLTPPFFFGPRNRLGRGGVGGPNASLGALNDVAGVVRDAALWSGVEVGPMERLEGAVAAKLGGERIVVDGREN